MASGSMGMTESSRSIERAASLQRALLGPEHCAAQRTPTVPLAPAGRLSCSGIVITGTGFSGRAIAETRNAARWCIASGILLVLAAAVVAIIGVLRLRWLSQDIDDEPVVTLLRGLEVRDRKSRNLRNAF